jgi:queuine tRNA-ribosyltransferase
MSFGFELLEMDSGPTRARRGRIRTAHGVIETPVFMPVGTQGTVKSLTPRHLKELGAEIILGNTYHLYLRPGMEVVAHLGGLHAMSGWSGPILTDSGGFQVFSLRDTNTISEEGVLFRSHLDGSKHLLTPEKAISIQETLGSDIMMAFDECPPAEATAQGIRDAVDRTTRWARRCVEARTREDNALFGIVQGGFDPKERQRSAAALLELPFEGYAIGGLSIGEGREITREMVTVSAELLPADKPRYLMGVGTPEDLLPASAQGSTCSTACSRPATRVTPSSSRHKETSTFATPRSEWTSAPSSRGAAVTRARISAGRISDTWIAARRSCSRPWPRSTTSTCSSR